MLAKAVEEHNPVVTGLKGSTLSQNYNATANALKPRPSSILNRAYPTPANPLKRTASRVSGRESPFSSQEQGLKKAMMDLTQPSTAGGRLEKLHGPVLFDENDFENDEDVDLDAEDSPIPSRPLSSTASSSTLLPDMQQKKPITPRTPVSSTPLPWSSSPISHHQMPPPKPRTPPAVTANTYKRRTLPWVEDAKKADQARRENSDRLCENLTGGVPPTSSEQAIMDQRKEHKERKLLDRQCTNPTRGEQEPDDHPQNMMRGNRDLERYRENMIRKGASGWVADKAVQGKKRRLDEEATSKTQSRGRDADTNTLCEDSITKGLPDIVSDKIRPGKQKQDEGKGPGQTYTPLPKDKPDSLFPWNKTASAVKEEQKRHRQGHRKLGKDNDGGPEKSNIKKKGREIVTKVFLSDEQTSVLNLVAEQKKSVFFTGSAGTGKSVLLREIIKVLRVKYIREPDRVAVTASTGLAACNVGGVTLHSFAGIGLGKEAVPELVKKIKRNQKAKTRWLRTKVLIIDEISMVDGDLFDKLEAIARAIRNNGRPFGGIQLVITGDFFQLPPVPDYGRVSKFSFDASTWNTSIEHTIGLTQVFRQKDPVFANMLNEMRLGKLTPKSVDAFRALNRPLSFADDFEATELFPTRNEVDYANSARMRNLSGREFEFKAVDGGSIADHAQRDKLLASCMAPASISLKKGAQVMLIKNIDETLVNGSVGKVVAFMDEKTFDIYHEDEDEFQAVETMELNDEEMTASRKKLKAMIDKDILGSTSQKWPLVRFAIADGSSRDLLCQQESWKIELPSGEVQASRMQVPLILAWALSIHKAQGQTLDRVKVDLGKIFEKGQAYVALSRATCQEGLQITRFDPKKVMAHDRVRTFYDSLYSVNEATNLRIGDRNSGISAKDHERDYIDSAYGIDPDEEQAMFPSPMAQFVGLSVLATLREPPAKVRGLVTAVVEQKLTLHQVTWLSGKSGPESLVVHGSNVVDVQIIDSEPREAVPQDVKKENFVDPAIVSYVRPEGYLAPDAKIHRSFVAASQTAVNLRAEPSLQAISPIYTEPVPIGAREEASSLHPAFPDTNTPSATLTAPFNDLSLDGDTHEEGLHPVDGKALRHQDTELLELKEVAQGRAPSSRKRARKFGARGGSLPAQGQDSPDMELHSTLASTHKRRGKTKGWRQTSLLEETTVETCSPRAGQHGQHRRKDTLKPATARFTKQTPAHSKPRRRRYREEEDQNGWATGDATDIQDMGDFDFEESLSKFDKRRVFEQIRQEDTTADEARLVNLNRLPAARPGTAGGKNLHYTENVLDSPSKKITTGGDIPNVGHSSTESELEITEAKISSGRSSRRNISRPSRAPSRKESALIIGDHYGSGSTFVTEPVGRLSRQTTHDRIESPKIKTDSSTSRYRKSSGTAHTGNYSFRIALSNGSCPCISPLQMLELEQLAMTELGLTEEMLTENAARCIGETAYGLASSEDTKHTDHRPLVVILAGNTKTGSRAIAAGRHLRNHNARVVLCILGIERELDLLESVQRQLTTFRSCGGQAIKQDGLMRTLRKLQAPTDLIVDALLGMHLAFDDLRMDDQAAYFQLVCWANGSEAGTLAIDLPSGIDPSNGIATTHDGSELVVDAEFILSLGAPKTGLLLAMDVFKNGANPSLFVADIGIASVAWKKFGTRRKGGVEFAGEWVAAVRWQEGGGV